MPVPSYTMRSVAALFCPFEFRQSLNINFCCFWWLVKGLHYGLLCRASFELEAGAVGQTTDFKEGTRRLEWNLKKASSKKDLIFSLLLSTPTHPVEICTPYVKMITCNANLNLLSQSAVLCWTSLTFGRLLVVLSIPFAQSSHFPRRHMVCIWLLACPVLWVTYLLYYIFVIRVFLESRKSHKGSRTSKHEFHYTYVQCFKVTGKTICCHLCANTNMI